MSAGHYVHRVTVQVRTETQNESTGAMTEVWATRCARKPAQVIPLSGRELEEAQHTNPRITHEVRFPYWRDYRADFVGGRTRLVYHEFADRTLEPVAPPIDFEERREEVRVGCREAA